MQIFGAKTISNHFQILSLILKINFIYKNSFKKFSLNQHEKSDSKNQIPHHHEHKQILDITFLFEKILFIDFPLRKPFVLQIHIFALIILMIQICQCHSIPSLFSFSMPCFHILFPFVSHCLGCGERKGSKKNIQMNSDSIFSTPSSFDEEIMSH